MSEAEGEGLVVVLNIRAEAHIRERGLALSHTFQDIPTALSKGLGSQAHCCTPILPAPGRQRQKTHLDSKPASSVE